MKKTGITELLLSLAARPEGVSTAEAIDGHTKRQLNNNASRLVTEGRLIPVGNLKFRRVFVHPEHAQAYREQVPALVAEHREAIHQHDLARGRAYKERQRQKAQEVGVKIPNYGKVKWEDKPAQITSETKVTLCPSPPAFGPAARLLHVKPAQMANRLPELKAGAEL